MLSFPHMTLTFVLVSRWTFGGQKETPQFTTLIQVLGLPGLDPEALAAVLPVVLSPCFAQSVTQSIVQSTIPGS